MSWKIMNKEVLGVQGGDPQVTIYMDSTADASDLPTTGIAAGSIAICTDTGLPVYIFGVDGSWHTA